MRSSCKDCAMCSNLKIVSIEVNPGSKISRTSPPEQTILQSSPPTSAGPHNSPGRLGTLNNILQQYSFSRLNGSQNPEWHSVKTLDARDFGSKCSIFKPLIVIFLLPSTASALLPSFFSSRQLQTLCNSIQSPTSDQ